MTCEICWDEAVEPMRFCKVHAEQMRRAMKEHDFLTPMPWRDRPRDQESRELVQETKFGTGR